jgi:hypothetical protein
MLGHRATAKWEMRYSASCATLAATCRRPRVRKGVRVTSAGGGGDLGRGGVPDKFYGAVIQPGSEEVRVDLGLEGKVALVMAASKGLGRAVATKLRGVL